LEEAGRKNIKTFVWVLDLVPDSNCIEHTYEEIYYKLGYDQDIKLNPKHERWIDSVSAEFQEFLDSTSDNNIKY
jgi:hypothetical protein